MLFHKSVGIASALFNPETGENERSVLLSAVTEAVRAEEREEEIRNLYVALTRARERLYVTGSIARGRADSLLRTARGIRYGARSQILDAGSRLSWILAALLREGSDCPDTVQVIPPDVAIPVPDAEKAPASPEPAPDATGESVSVSPVFDPQAYPLRSLREVPTKAAASGLSPDFLDRLADGGSDDDPAAIAAAIGVMRTAAPDFDALLRERREIAPTEIGTAMHMFLEACDFRALSAGGVDAEIARLRDSGILSEKAVSLLNLRQLRLFRASSLMEEILAAAEVLREQKFAFNLPLTALTRHPERFIGAERETVFVQGSIDLLLVMPGGEIRLYDYKTDRLTPAEREDPQALARDLALRHGNQLACYAHAVRALFGKAPSCVSIYSFPTGKSIPLEIDSRWLG